MLRVLGLLLCIISIILSILKIIGIISITNFWLIGIFVAGCLCNLGATIIEYMYDEGIKAMYHMEDNNEQEANSI